MAIFSSRLYRLVMKIIIRAARDDKEGVYKAAKELLKLFDEEFEISEEAVGERKSSSTSK